MKKKVVSSLLLGLALVTGLTACGGNNANNDNTKNNDKTTSTPVVETTTDKIETRTDSEAGQIASYKKTAKDLLIKLIKSGIEKIENEDLKASLQEFYDAEEQYIESISDLETAKTASVKIANDAKDFIVKSFIPLAKTKIDSVINPLIDAITYEALKTNVEEYYALEIAKFEKLESLDDISFFLKEIVGDTQTFIKKQAEELLIELKNKALEELDSYVTALIEKIPYDSVKIKLESFCTEEKKKLEAIDSLDDVASCVETIKTDLVSFSVTEIKNIAIAALDSIVNPAIEKLTNADLKVSIQNFYTAEKDTINNINDLDSAKEAVSKVATDVKTFANNTLLPLAIEKINSVINPLIENITYADLKTSVKNYYDNEIKKIGEIESLDDVANLYKSIIDDTKAFIVSETEKVLVALKNKALEELDPYVTALIAKIPYDTLKNDTQAFYTEEKKILEAVDTIDGVAPCIEKIKSDLETYALTEMKKIAIEELEDIVDAGLAKLPNQDLKDDLEDFADDEIAKLNAVTKLEDVPTTLATVLEETADHIKSLLISTVKDYLSRLTQIETATAYDYLPAAMSPFYAANLVNPADIAYDFTTNTQVSNINLAGFGEQWQMVVENINQSITMAKVFNVAQTALNAAGNAVDIYITNSYADEMEYEFSGEGYNGVFEFKNGKLIFNINITTSTTVPGVGAVKPIVKMEYDLTNEAKGMFISLGSAYKIKYVIREDAYEMATTYGLTALGHEGSRSSYLSISKANNKTTGHIYEYTTLDGEDKVQACADFYVENNYVSVVGNKASGMTAFTGYVNELYKADKGTLIGYEIREEKTIVGVTAQYNTLWFNLADIKGITSVKVTDKTNANESSRSTVDVYINGSTSLFVPTYNKKIVKTSRKYDIELRKRFYYSYDETEQKYVCHEVEIPMMFIQEGDNFSSFITDMTNENGVAASVAMSTSDLNKILNDYDTLIDIFKNNKDNMSSDQIIAYLAQYE